MTNPKRGEVELEFGDTKYLGRIYLDTIIRMETILGMSILKLTQQLSEGNMTTSECIAILQPVLKSSQQKLEEAQIKNLVWEHGIANAIRECGKVLTVALSTGDEGNEEVLNEVV